MEETFEIMDEQIDVGKIMDKIKEKVRQKKESGVYDKYDLSKVTALEIESVEDEEQFLEYYLKVIGRTCDIDIGYFEIVSKGGILGRPVVILKKIIWHLLKFYTYRLFNQQKEFNCQIVNAVLSLNRKIDAKMEEINHKLDVILRKEEGKSGGD